MKSVAGLSMEVNFPKKRRDNTRQGEPKQGTTRSNENILNKKTPKTATNAEGSVFLINVLTMRFRASVGVGEGFLAIFLLLVVPRRAL